MSATITLPDIQVQLSLDQIVAAIRQLEPSARAQLARALAKDKLDEDLAQLIVDLYNSPPIDDVSDEDIRLEINAVRQRHCNS